MGAELSWHDWIKHNLTEKCSAQELFDILIDNGFHRVQAQSMMGKAAEQIAATEGDQNSTEKGNKTVITPAIPSVHSVTMT